MEWLGEQPTRLPIMIGESPFTANCPGLGGKHIRCTARQPAVIGADVKATGARRRKARGWELPVWRAKLVGLNISE